MQNLISTNPTSNQKSTDLTWLGLVLLIGLFVTSVFLIHKADDSKPADWNESRLAYLPSGKMLKPMVMDLDEAVADVLWIQGVIYFAGAYLEGKSYQWLGHILELVTVLNPQFHEAYEFGGTVLSKHKPEIPATLKLLDRGIETFPKDWRLRVYASLAQLTLDSNYTKAAEYLKPVTLEKDVPNHIRTLCATLLNKGGGRRVALAFLVDRYIHSDNTINQEVFLEKILKLYPRKEIAEDKRKEILLKILFEARAAPTGMDLVILGIIHEFLGETMSPKTQQLVESLYH